MSKAAVEKQTQTGEPDPSDGYDSVRPRTSETTRVSRSTESASEPSVQSRSAHSDSPGAVTRSSDHNQTQQSGTSGEPESRRYPTRERRTPSYLDDFMTEDGDSDGVRITIDYCCRAVCGIPQTFGGAMGSANSKEWVKAMDEEIQSLNENKTFTPTALPIGKKTVGGR